MTLGRKRMVKIYAYYRDANVIERIVSNFRKLLIDIDWIYGYRYDDEGLYIFYLALRDHPNFDIAILNLSKTVDIEKVEVLENASLTPFKYINNNFIEVKDTNDVDDKSFIIYIPKYSRVRVYSWGEIYDKDI